MAEISLTRPAHIKSALFSSDVTRIRVATCVILLLAYEGIARSGLLYQDVVPSLLSIFRALGMVLITGDFYFHLGVTMIELLAAFALGTLAGIAVGISFGLWRLLGEVLDPWVHYLAPTPKIVFLPIVVLFFGTGMGSKIAMGTVSAFFPVAVATFAAMRLVRPVFLKVAVTLHASTWQTVRLVYLPSLVAPVVGAMRIGLGATVIGVLLAETKMSRSGLGNLIAQDYSFFRIPEMYSLLIVVFFIAWAGNAAMEALSRRLSHFQG